MPRDLNDCKFIGRIGKDIELKYLPAGDAVINFSIACNDDYKDKSGEIVKRTEWINLVAFKRSAEIIAQYMGKGDQIFVSTKQKTRKWTDRDGNDRYSTENEIMGFQMLGKTSGSEAAQQGGHSPAVPVAGDASHRTSQAGSNNLGGRGEAAESPGASGDHQRADGGQSASQAGTDDFDDDIPF